MAFVYNKPYVGFGASPTDYVCNAQSASLTAESVMADASTFCTPGLEIPSHETWTFEVELLMDYTATTGIWDIFNGYATADPRVVTAITLRPDTAAIGTGNPEANFDIWVPQPDFMMARPGETFVWTMSATVVGDPVFTTS